MNDISRRLLLAGTTSLLAAPSIVRAQDAFPSRPIKFIVPYTPAGATDNISRIIGARMSELAGQQVIIENRAGGGGTIGTEAIAKATPDGYTIGLVTVSMFCMAPSLYATLPYDPVKGFSPMAGMAVWPNMLVVNNDVPAKTVPELIALLKSKPGKLNMASSGSGTTIHLAGEMFKQMTGTDMVHVPYKGSAPAVTDLLGNQIGIMFDNMPSAIQHVRSGKLVPIAVTTAKRSPELPNVPTIAEAGVPGYEATSWFGMFAPAGTPAPVLAKLNSALVKVLNQADVKKKINEQGAETYSETPEQFAAFIQAESVKWGKVVKESGASLD